jgi:hypothetical protein
VAEDFLAIVRNLRVFLPFHPPTMRIPLPEAAPLHGLARSVESHQYLDVHYRHLDRFRTPPLRIVELSQSGDGLEVTK